MTTVYANVSQEVQNCGIAGKGHWQNNIMEYGEEAQEPV
jgi:hypothetical protein